MALPRALLRLAICIAGGAAAVPSELAEAGSCASQESSACTQRAELEVSGASSLPHVLIVGATGIIGRAAVELFDGFGADWRVTAVSRRPLDYSTSNTRHVAVDLNDTAACEVAFGQMGDITHAIYTALYEKQSDVLQSWLDAEQMSTNDRMMRNFLVPLLRAAKGLRSLQFMQGGKAYGLHVFGPNPEIMPFRERDERVEHENFYWLQEDFVKAKQQESGGAWHYTIWRPPWVLGYALKSQLNVLTAMAVHAVATRELGRPLSFPGLPIPLLVEHADSRLIAKAFLWATNAATAANQTFNIVNGDQIIWKTFYGKMAKFFGMESSGPRAVQLAVEMRKPEYQEAWARLVQRHSLQNYTIDDLVGSSFSAADLNLFMPHWLLTWLAPLMKPITWAARPFMIAAMGMSRIKLNKAGFTETVDTEDACLEWLAEMQRMKLIPP